MDYSIKPIGKTCSATGQPLAPGDTCFSVLLERPNESVRLDYSRAAWNGPPPDAIGYWKCRVPQRDEAKRRLLDPDALLRHFELLSENANPAEDALRYVLALLLVQRRRLRIESTHSDGAVQVLRLVGYQGEGPFEVPEHPLEADQIATLQRELNDRLAAAQ
jgi:hypothetical protein